MNSLISIVITFNLMMTPLPAPTTEITLTNPIMENIASNEIVIDALDLVIPPAPGSVEISLPSIIGDGFEIYPCPDNYPGCCIIRWEMEEGKETTICRFHKIKHEKEWEVNNGKM